MDREAFGRWLDAYFAAWASNEPDEVAALFVEDATYRTGPYADPWRGRDEIVRRWTAGAADLPSHRWEILAVEGDVGVARWRVTIASDGRTVDQDGVLVITFGPDGRCRDHLEWYERRTRP